MKVSRNKKGIVTIVLGLFFMLLGNTGAKAAGVDPNDILGVTNWEGTEVYDANGYDVTEKNTGFIGRAKYDAATNRYEFFDKVTNQSRGDKGVFFVTQDGKRRILLSEMGYQVSVDMVRLDDEMFTYRRQGVQKDGTEGYVYVEHVPYSGNLVFTSSVPELSKTTGEIIKDRPGKDILSSTFWQGTVAKDDAGNDVSEFNSSYLGLARYDLNSGRYEFFRATDGQTRGDFGYYDVINGNKERTHISLGFRYNATLELTELNEKRFTYTRNGKDKDGNDIAITVEHEPYTGNFPLEFTFNPSTEAVIQPPINSDTNTPKSNATVEVNRATASGVVKFSHDVSSQASIVFNKLNVETSPTSLAEKELGKANLSVIDTRQGTENDRWKVRAALDNGQFGDKGFVANRLGVVLNPTTTENAIKVETNVSIDGSSQQDIFTIDYQAGSPERKSVILNPTLSIGQLNLLQSGVYGANVTWTLGPAI